MSYPLSRQGFSLFEISIVLAIVGLMVGGVLLGRDLVQAARLKTVTNDLRLYETAFYAFQQKYNAIPGDMTNASRFWPAATDGNGDGLIFDSGTNCEDVFFFEHLSYAGMAPFMPVGCPVDEQELGVHVPKGPFDDQGYRAESSPCDAGGCVVKYNRRGLNFIAASLIGTGDLAGPFFSAMAAWSIDTKIDDGLPVTGKISATGRDDSDEGLDPADCVEGANSAFDMGLRRYNRVRDVRLGCNMFVWLLG